MSDDDKKYQPDFTSLRELFTEYVTLNRKVDSGKYELRIPWYSITQIEGFCSPDECEESRQKGEICSELWWTANEESNKGDIYETPAEIEAQIQAAKDRMFAAMKQHRTPLIF
jgi:hypothetical protein